MNITMFLINLVCFVTAWILLYVDHSWSKVDVYRGLSEANKIWRDKYWFYNPGRGLLVLVMLIPAFVILFFVPGIKDWLFIFFVPIIIGEIFILQRKKKHQKLMYDKQVKTLLDILENPKDYLDYFKLMSVSRNGRDFLYLFPWIYTDSNGSNNVLLLQKKLLEDLGTKSPSYYLNFVQDMKRYHAEL